MIGPRLVTLRSCKVIGRGKSTHATAHSLNDIKQMIPTAVKRSPTDVLSALSSTVGKDPTAPHFQFIDDPAMIPSTLTTMRSYYMAKEMGKRAARELATEWPTLFAFDRDEPRLEVFRPQGKPDPLQVEATEENLLSLVESRCVKDACMLYERMRSDGVDISEEAKDSLFALASFYNNEDPPLSEMEEWHGIRNLAINKKTPWISAGVADLVYESLPASPLRKAILITALCKHSGGGNAAAEKRARELFKELVETDAASIPSRTFAAILSLSSPWTQKLEIVSTMKKVGVKPEENVWNEMINQASKLNSYEERVTAVRNILGEMKACGEKGSLRMFDSLLIALDDEKEGTSEKEKAKKEKKIRVSLSALTEVLAELEKRKNIQIVSPSDSNFFCTAMNLARMAGNLPLARRILSLYEDEKNGVKLVALTNEGSFYNSFLLLCFSQVESVDELHKTYLDLVPRLVGVSKNMCMTLFRRLEATPHWGLLHRLICDCISARLLTDFHTSNALRSALINTPLQSLSVEERDEYTSLVHRIVSISVEMSRFTAPNQKRLQYKLSPFVISEAAVLLTRVGERGQAWELLEMLCEEENSQGEESTIQITGTVRMTAMNELLDDAIRRGHAENAATCIQLIATTDVKKQRLEQMVNTVIQRCGVTSVQARILSGFVRLRPQ